jgi:hypothetical protein
MCPSLIQKRDRNGGPAWGGESVILENLPARAQVRARSLGSPAGTDDRVSRLPTSQAHRV